MKSTITILLLFSLVGLKAQTFSIKGDLSRVSMPIKQVSLYYSFNGSYKTDTCDVKNGRYFFNDSINGPGLVYLRAKIIKGISAVEDNLNDSMALLSEQKNTGKITSYPEGFTDRYFEMIVKYSAQLFISPTDIRISSDSLFHAINVQGDPYQNDFLSLTKQAEIFMKPISDSLGYYYKIKDTTNNKRLQSDYELLYAKMGREVYLKYAKDHPASPVSLYALRDESLGEPFQVELIQPVYEGLAANIRNSYEGRKMGEEIQASLNSSVGRQEMDFTMLDTAGKPVTLSSFKGKYVLLDFWASWCVPCRAESPNLVRSYRQFKDKNFVILSVSFDSEKNKWMKAIHTDKMDWYHITDFGGFNNAAAKLYNIKAIPDNFLIDPSGKIIARNLMGEDLEKKLKEVL